MRARAQFCPLQFSIPMLSDGRRDTARIINSLYGRAIFFPLDARYDRREIPRRDTFI
jgi:hypothetical protein